MASATGEADGAGRLAPVDGRLPCGIWYATDHMILSREYRECITRPKACQPGSAWRQGGQPRKKPRSTVSADSYQDRTTLLVSLKLFESMSRHQLAELIHSWCSPSIFEHSATKSEDEIREVAAATVENGAALSIIEAIKPRRHHGRGTLRPRPAGVREDGRVGTLPGRQAPGEGGRLPSFVGNFYPFEGLVCWQGPFWSSRAIGCLPHTHTAGRPSQQTRH